MNAIASKLGSVSGKSVDGFAPMSLEAFMPPDLNYSAVLLPSHLVDAVREAYKENIQSTVESAYEYYTQEIALSFDNLVDIHQNWTLGVRALYSIEAMGDILIPDDYEPPLYQDLSDSSITDLNQEQQIFFDMSKVKYNLFTFLLHIFVVRCSNWKRHCKCRLS